MKAITRVLAVCIFIGFSVNANAALIIKTLTISGTDWSDLLGSGTLPAVDPVTLNFSISFDNAADISNATSDFIINSFNLPIASLFYGYDSSSDTLILAAENASPGSCSTFPFCTFIKAISTGPSSVYMSHSDTNGEFLSSTVAVAESSSVPVPATLALFGLGLAGLGWSRRKKA